MYVVGVVHCLGKCVVTRTHHCRVTWSSFTALKIHCALPGHPLSPVYPGHQGPVHRSIVPIILPF